MSAVASFMVRFGARLVANGYPVIPIQPGTKKPGCHRGGGWRDYPAWTRHAARATTDLELQLWTGWPDAGIGIVGGSVAAVDIDIAEDPALALEIEKLEPVRHFLSDDPDLIVFEFDIAGVHRATGRPYATSLLETWAFRDGKVSSVKPHYFNVPD